MVFAICRLTANSIKYVENSDDKKEKHHMNLIISYSISCTLGAIWMIIFFVVRGRKTEIKQSSEEKKMDSVSVFKPKEGHHEGNEV